MLSGLNTIAFLVGVLLMVHANSGVAGWNQASLANQRLRIYPPLIGQSTVLATPSQCMESLLSSGGRRIPGSAFQASSELLVSGGEDRRYAAESIRDESGDRAWCSGQRVGSQLTDYVQVDLGDLNVIHKLVLHGHLIEGMEAGFTQHFYIQYKREPTEAYWRTFRQLSPVKTARLSGSVNAHVPKFVVLSPPLIARWIRVYPFRQPPGMVCLRLEVYGCLFKDNLVEYQIPEGSQTVPPYGSAPTVGDNFGIPVKLAAPIRSLTLGGGGGQAFSDACYDGVRVDPGSLLDKGLGCLVDQLVAPPGGGGSPDPSHHLFVGWHRGRWTGSQGGANSSRSDVVDMLFRFAGLRKFSRLAMVASNNFPDRVRIPHRVEIRFSIHGKLFSNQPVIAHDLQTDNSTSGPLVVDVNLEQRVGKYIQVKLFFADDWLMLSEVKFVSEPTDDLVTMYDTAAPRISRKPTDMDTFEATPLPPTANQMLEPSDWWKPPARSWNVSSPPSSPGGLREEVVSSASSGGDWLTAMLMLFFLSIFLLVASVTGMFFVKRHWSKRRQGKTREKTSVVGNSELVVNGAVGIPGGGGPLLLQHCLAPNSEGNQWSRSNGGGAGGGSAHQTVSTGSPGGDGLSGGDSSRHTGKPESASTPTTSTAKATSPQAGRDPLIDVEDERESEPMALSSSDDHRLRRRRGNRSWEKPRRQRRLSSLWTSLFCASKPLREPSSPQILRQQRCLLPGQVALFHPEQQQVLPYYTAVNNNNNTTNNNNNCYSNNNLGVMWSVTSPQVPLATSTGIGPISISNPTTPIANLQTINGLVQLDLSKTNGVGGQPLMLFNGQPLLQLPVSSTHFGPGLPHGVPSGATLRVTPGVPQGMITREGAWQPGEPIGRSGVVEQSTSRMMTDLGVYTTIEGPGLPVGESDGDSNGASTMSPEYASASHLQEYSPFVASHTNAIDMPHPSGNVPVDLGDYWMGNHYQQRQGPPGYQLGLPTASQSGVGTNPLIFTNRLANLVADTSNSQHPGFVFAYRTLAAKDSKFGNHLLDQYNPVSGWNNNTSSTGGNNPCLGNTMLVQLPAGDQSKDVQPSVFWDYGSRLLTLGRPSMPPNRPPLGVPPAGQPPWLLSANPVGWGAGSSGGSEGNTCLHPVDPKLILPDTCLRPPAPPSTPPPPTPPSSGGSLASS